jgi:hypothetical protein
MSSHLETLRERRLALVAACDQDRLDVAEEFGSLQRELHMADKIVRIAQRFNRNKVVIGALAVGLIAVPALTRKWIRRAAWWLPIAIQGYRIIRDASGERRHRREATS